MIRIAAFFGLIGLALATAVIAWSGYDQVLAALGQAGWGIVWTSLFHLVAMYFCVWGWQMLLPGRRKHAEKRISRPGQATFFYFLWIRAAVNNLMPVARIGGEIIAVRLMMKHGVRKSSAIACTVVETTLSVIGQFVFVLIGVSFFVLRVSDQDVTAQLLFGLVLSLFVIGALVMVQRAGFFGLLTRLFTLMFRDKWKNFAGNTARLDRAVLTMYRRRGRALFCGVMQFASWIWGTVEIWVGLSFLGHAMPLLDCMMIEALIQATGSAAFIVPGALGVQEAGFLLFGHLLGLTPEIATALAMIRRCRDLLLYVPGLVAWQIQEGKWLIAKPKSASSPRIHPSDL
jgi:putative membrane protein